MSEVFAGKPAEERLEREVLQLMPAGEQAGDMQYVLEHLRAMQGTELYRYAGKTGKAVVSTSIDLISKLSTGIIPTSPEGQSEFYLNLWAAMPNFVSTKVKVLAKVEGDKDEGEEDLYDEPSVKTIRGVEALVANWEEIKMKKDATPKDYEDLCLFSKWLPMDVQAAVNNGYTECLKMSVKGVGVAASSSSSSSSSKNPPAKRRAPAPQHKNKAARTFLGF